MNIYLKAIAEEHWPTVACGERETPEGIRNLAYSYIVFSSFSYKRFAEARRDVEVAKDRINIAREELEEAFQELGHAEAVLRKIAL